MSITKMRNSFGTWLKWGLGVIALIFLIGCFTMYGPGNFGGSGQDGRSLTNVAVVNGQPISNAEFTSIVQRQEKQQEAMMGGQTPGVSQKAVMEADVLDQLIDRYLRLQAAKQEGLDVSGKAIDGEIDKIYKQQVDMLKTQFAGEKKGKKMSDDDLDRELAKLSGENMPKSVREMRDQLDTKETRNAIEADLLIKALDKKLEGTAKNATDADLIDSYKKVHARHILVKTGVGGRPDEQAKRRAEEVLKKVKAGDDFAKLAREYSDDPGSKDKGGDLGYFGRGQMVPEFEKAAFSMKPGQTSGLVKTQFGYHIVQTQDFKTEMPKDFQSKKKMYADQFAAQNREKAKSEYYEKLKKQAKIEVSDPFLQGVRYLKQGPDPKNMALALSAFDRAQKANPDDPRSYVLQAQVYMQKGDKDEARKLLEQILDVKSIVEDAELRMMLGQIYMEKKENDKAVKQFQLASDVGYNNINIHFQLQNSFKQLNRPDLAAKEEKYVKDYIARMQAEQAANRPAPQPAKAGSPSGR